MADPIIALILVVILALAFDFSNGWHDAYGGVLCPPTGTNDCGGGQSK